MIISNLSELPAQVLNLPTDFTIPEKRVKRSPQPVDFSVFTDEQRQAVEGIIDYLEDKSPHRMITLRGYAGTGKTFTVGRLQDFLLYAKKLKTAVSAPTNKAVQVGKDLCDIVDPKLTFSTIHKLLGLRESYDNDGRLKFIPDPESPPSLTAYDVLFVDEASMFDDDLFKLINPFVEQGVKIIFVGDPAQIPPVNRIDCIPFIRKKQLEYKIGVFDLTEILRQAKENPLLKFATQIREQRMNETFDYDYKVDLVENMGIVPIKKLTNDVIYTICEKYFANDIFSNYPDFMKVIAWRNKTVDAINVRVRQLIYKMEVLPRIMPDEKLIADEPIKTREQAILTTNSEFAVKKFEIKETRYVGKIGEDVVVREDFKYYETEVEAMTERGLRKYNIMIIHEDSLTNYNTALDTIKLYIHRLPPFERKGKWKTYYDLKKYFAAVKYNYAITAHKAQGSSYENVMMIEWDMNENIRCQERNRIRYVAATRARKYLFIVK